MRRGARIVALVVCLLTAMLITLVYALFHGYFDHGRFEIKQAQWSPSKQLAVIARRSDDEALNGDEYFVLIGDHVFSPDELRRAYYRQEEVFSTDSSCLTLRWEGPSKLVVTCNDSSIKPGDINLQKRHGGAVDISYVNIPLK